MNIRNDYLDGKYQENNPTFHVEDSAWKASQIKKGLEIVGRIPATVAEVGCGAGEILACLSREYPEARFTGYELSPQGYAMCAERASERVSFRDCDIFTSGEKYDVLLCIDVFEHVEDYIGFLRKLREQGSLFVFHIPLDMNVQMVARVAPIQRVRDAVGHLHYYSRQTALATLRDCGFVIKADFYTPNGVDRPKSWKAKILQIPRKLLQIASVEFSARFLGGYSLLVVAEPE